MNSSDLAALVISRSDHDHGMEQHIDIPLRAMSPEAIDAVIALREESDHLFLRVNGRLIALDRDAPIKAIVGNFLHTN